MENFQLKSAQLVSKPNPRNPLLVSHLLSLPNNEGAIFGLIKILGNINDNRQQIADIISDHLTRFHETLNDHTNIPRRFEQVLQAINEEIGEAVRDIPSIPILDIHSVIGIVYKEQIFLSGIGKLHALFMHRTAKQRYVLYDLDAQFKTEDSPDWHKTFVTVLDGELHPGDVFYLATRVSAQEMSAADLQDTLITLPPSGALKRVQQHLKSDTAYGAVCFRMADEVKGGPPKKVNPLTSIEQFGKTQEDTANLLGEQSPDIGSWVSKITSPLLKRLSSSSGRGAKNTFILILRSLVKILALVSIFLIKILTKLYRLLIMVLSRIIKAFRSKQMREQAKVSVKGKVSQASELYKKLPPQTKYIALGLVLLIVIIIVSWIVASKNKEERQADADLQTVITQITEKKDAAQASLIYDDDDQARRLLTEALSLLETIPTENNRQSDIASLRDELNLILSELRGETAVQLTVLANLRQDNATSTFVSGIDVGGVIYGITNQNELYRYQDLEQKLLKETVTTGAIGNIKMTTDSANSFLFIDSNNKLGRANVTNNTLNPITSGVDRLSSVDAIDVYNDNLYVLTAAGNQVVKMRPQGDGFEAGTSWISARNSDLSAAVDLAIDGDVYVLTRTGIVKFISGKEQTLTLDSVEPVFGEPVDIWTSLASKYLYVLDKLNGRVIVYEKTGNFVTQYVAPDLKNGLSLVVREDKNTIIVVTDTKIMSFPATHLVP